jgi:hypothetical protein
MEPDISILRKTGHFYFALTDCGDSSARCEKFRTDKTQTNQVPKKSLAEIRQRTDSYPAIREA